MNCKVRTSSRYFDASFLLILLSCLVKLEMFCKKAQNFFKIFIVIRDNKLIDAIFDSPLLNYDAVQVSLQ